MSHINPLAMKPVLLGSLIRIPFTVSFYGFLLRFRYEKLFSRSRFLLRFPFKVPLRETLFTKPVPFTVSLSGCPQQVLLPEIILGFLVDFTVYSLH